MNECWKNAEVKDQRDRKLREPEANTGIKEPLGFEDLNIRDSGRSVLKIAAEANRSSALFAKYLSSSLSSLEA